VTESFLQRNPETKTLDELNVGLWRELTCAAGDLSHAWSHLAIATGTESGPRQRLMILRHVDSVEGRLFLHTDLRSPKVQQIERCAVVSGLAYDFTARVQVTISATGIVHRNDALCDDHWQTVSLASRRNYLGLRAPGIPSSGPSTNLAEEIRQGPLTEQGTLPGRGQFGVLELAVRECELLWLRPFGNLRACFQRTASGWESHWIEP